MRPTTDLAEARIKRIRGFEIPSPKGPRTFGRAPALPVLPVFVLRASLSVLPIVLPGADLLVATSILILRLTKSAITLIKTIRSKQLCLALTFPANRANPFYTFFFGKMPQFTELPIKIILRPAYSLARNAPYPNPRFSKLLLLPQLKRSAVHEPKYTFLLVLKL